jgi:hypothetical protein
MKLTLKAHLAKFGKQIKDSRPVTFFKGIFKKKEDQFDLDPATIIAIGVLVIVLGAKAASGGFDKKAKKKRP